MRVFSYRKNTKNTMRFDNICTMRREPYTHTHKQTHAKKGHQKWEYFAGKKFVI